MISYKDIIQNVMDEYSNKIALAGNQIEQINLYNKQNLVILNITKSLNTDTIDNYNE